MTLEALKEEISQIPEAECWQLLEWLDARQNRLWDREIEEDFAPGGRGEALMARVKADVAAGESLPLEDVLLKVESRSKG